MDQVVRAIAIRMAETSHSCSRVTQPGDRDGLAEVEAGYGWLASFGVLGEHCVSSWNEKGPQAQEGLDCKQLGYKQKQISTDATILAGV